MALSQKHIKALRRAGAMWSVRPIVHQGAGKVAVVLADGDLVHLDPSTAHALGRALVNAAMEAAKED